MSVDTAGTYRRRWIRGVAGSGVGAVVASACAVGWAASLPESGGAGTLGPIARASGTVVTFLLVSLTSALVCAIASAPLSALLLRFEGLVGKWRSVKWLCAGLASGFVVGWYCTTAHDGASMTTLYGGVTAAFAHAWSRESPLGRTGTRMLVVPSILCSMTIAMYVDRVHQIGFALPL
jgi:hypothetical protein